MNPYKKTPSTHILDLLVEIEEYMGSRADVVSEPNEDGSYSGNKEMWLYGEIKQWVEILDSQSIHMDELGVHTICQNCGSSTNL